MSSMTVTHICTDYVYYELSALTDGLLQEKIQGILKGGNDGLTYPAASSPVTDCFQSHQVAQSDRQTFKQSHSQRRRHKTHRHLSAMTQ